MSRLPIEHNYQLLDQSNPTVQSNVIQNNSDMAANSKWIMRNKTQPKTQKEKEDAIINAHALRHNGSQKIFLALWQQGLWWLSVRNDINSVIGQCLPCQRHAVVKEDFHPVKSLITTYPMDMIQMDSIVGLRKTIEGYCNILTIIDIATGYIWAKPLRSKTMLEVAQRLMTIQMQFGQPKSIYTDDGTEFKNL
jgi:hypothetical protein